LFIGQDGKPEPEIHINLESVEANGSVYSICDSMIDFPSLSGGEWVNSTEINGKTVRLSVSTSYNNEERCRMNNDNHNDWGYNPQQMDNIYPHEIISFPMSYYKQILPLFSTLFHIIPLFILSVSKSFSLNPIHDTT